MLKRINWKGVFIGFIWIVSLAGLGVLMSFIEVKKQTVKCTDVKISIPGANNFIEREEIDVILKQGFGELKGRNLQAINIHEIEKRIASNPYIAFARVYEDMDGVINISVKQRQPILRVINTSNQDFYIDNEGLKMPMSPNFTANVLVATGNIQESFSGSVSKLNSSMLEDLYKTALYIKQDTLWDAQIEQLFVNPEAEIELVPRVGIQKIILGDADNLEIKMNNLLVFYKKAMPKVGWETYKTINIKYTNQIICEKNKIASEAKKSLLVVADTNRSTEISVDKMMKAELDKVRTQNSGSSAESADAKSKNNSTSEKKNTIEKSIKTQQKI